MELRLQAAAHYAVIRTSLLVAEREVSEAIVTAQGAGEHEMAAEMQGLLRKLRRLHRLGERIATTAAALDVVGGPIQTRSGGSADDKERDDDDGES